MPIGRNRTERGFTLVELLIVIAIVSVLASIAVPSMSRMGLFSQNDLTRTGKGIYMTLTAARVYATTFHVNTAVVYSLDNYVGPGINPDNIPGMDAASECPDCMPVVDNYTGDVLRVVRSAAIVYELPSTLGAYAGKYVSIPGDLGNFREFDGEMVVLLNNPDSGEPYYFSMRPRFEPDGNEAPDLDLGMLGMSGVELYYPDSGPYLRDFEPDELDRDPREDPWFSFPAHVFQSSGRLRVTGQGAERFTIHVAPSPDKADPTDRFYDAEADGWTRQLPSGAYERNLVTLPIQIFRSTGRIKVSS